MSGLINLEDQLDQVDRYQAAAMKRGGLYIPAWRSPNDADRKLGVMVTGNEAGTLLPRRDCRKVVPVCIHIEDNGLCTEDEDEREEACLTATNSDVDRADECTRLMSHQLDRVEQGEVRRDAAGSLPSSSSSSVSGNLHGYNDSDLKSSVYELPPELVGSTTSPAQHQPPASASLPRSGSATELRHSRVQGLASDALSAVVRSCRSSVQSRPPVEDDDDRDRTSSVSSPAVFVVSDSKQLVIFNVDRTSRSAGVSPAARLALLSHSDQTLNA